MVDIARPQTRASIALPARTHTQTRTVRLSSGQFRRRKLELSLLAVAAALLVGSLFLPYWNITLHAPQYPRGLNVAVYTHKLTGDVSEVDGLNHYIGMMQLGEAASLERSISRFAVPVVALLALSAFFVRGRSRWLLVAPVMLYPIVFVVDLAAWLYYAGHSLDPTAALSSSIGEFTPRVIGTGIIGQFSTEARFSAGFYLVLLAAALVVAAMTIGRKRHAIAS
jgi:hypothetical protein